MHLYVYSYFESADGAILMFDVTNKQSFINLVSDEGNSRKIGKSWMKELMFKAVDYRHPAMVFCKLLCLPVAHECLYMYSNSFPYIHFSW